MSEAWLPRNEAYVWRPYCQHRTAPPPLAVASTRGCRLVLADGTELVDGVASWWTAAHGYAHPHIRAKVAAQLEAMPHVAFGGLAHEAGYTLAARLAGFFAGKLSHVFFTESGSVAVEVALKMAMQSFYNAGRPRRTVVAFHGAYHGDTFAAMSLCDPVDGMHNAFTGSGVRVVHMPLPAAGDEVFERAFAEVAREVACVIVEPLVQCAGGMRVHEPEALRRIRRACDAHGALLVFDEIATGFYRTGKRFALDEAGVVPDIVVLGKALTGGTLPLAAAIANDAVFEAFLDLGTGRELQHGPTYMANPLACAAAHGSLDLFEREDYEGRVQRLGAAMRARFETLRGRRNVVDVRVRGAIAAIEMKAGTARPSIEFVARGAFVRPLRLRRADIVYLMPPLVIEGEDLEVLLDAVDRETRA
ncbi:MAG TPA: adenosylmethionine--8-amino-7-oxononanoate transaminase [Polyangiaceae bacterium]|jgi:adenosylmethionine-8-amino-7-oxononanoate aminotransferase|nr:adenosylmethionine--8-amino-7-oxononanoate transaminase [Polyangiaceae bacterium]